MNNYLPYVFGITSLSIGVILVLLSLGFCKRKNRTAEQIGKDNGFSSKYGMLFKICGVILILRGGYDILDPDPNRYMLVSNEASQLKEKKEDIKTWEGKDRNTLVTKCIEETGLLGASHPEIIKEYCECSVDNIMIAMTKDEYLENSQKPIEEQKKDQLPLFQSCYDVMTKKLDSLDNRISN